MTHKSSTFVISRRKMHLLTYNSADSCLEVDNEQKLIENDRLHMMEAYNLQAGINGGNADVYCTKGQYIEAFVFYHMALHYARHPIGIVYLRFMNKQCKHFGKK